VINIGQFSRNSSFALTGGSSDKISEFKVGCQRAVIILTNGNAAGGANIWVAVGEEASSGKGIQLSPGQSINFSMDSGYKPSNESWYAYAAAAGTTLLIYEEIITR
jgi:hypothetical protein